MNRTHCLDLVNLSMKTKSLKQSILLNEEKKDRCRLITNMHSMKVSGLAELMSNKVEALWSIIFHMSTKAILLMASLMDKEDRYFKMDLYI